MTHRWKPWRTAAWLTLWLACAVAVADDKPTLTWLLRDLPPLTILEGDLKGQGAVDQMLPLLIEGLPQYNHRLLRVNRARGLQMLQTPAFTCDPTLLWTPERAKFVAYSTPSYRTLSNGLIVRDQDRQKLVPFMHGQALDFPALLAAGTLKVGLVAERSYGTQIDSMLKNANPQTLAPHYGNDAVGSLLQMQHLGRLQALLGYWPEIRYIRQKLGLSADEFDFVPIKGVDQYQLIHIGCSNTAQGREAIALINAQLLLLRKDSRVDAFYARWLDPDLREQYLKDAQRFFAHPGP
ncbi:TIGR02285 family protein [Pseudomonas sp. R5(2019)]|uniref:TIGR02285 family protein n=1 Tax=Pseudomonas sp. R5(2019) TaxID=2697566 RepID=UPI0014123134|nr:TIGR02285 family protein [Pseudomonas sp. R5(2019)]NBA95425.1 TIGR02285 family protein [Pseudomonas sp. R5(2019)]